jgi:DNA-binding transcriptional MocR family regulator
MLIPGLRFGYLSVREEEYRIITEYKRYSDLTSPLLIQMALESFINLGRYQNHIEKSRRTYKKRRDAAIEMISESFPEGFSFTVPQGGLFLWINYPESFKEDLFLRRAETAGVKVAGGKIFLTDPNRESPGFRMNFAHLKKEELRKGIGLLTEILSN